MKIRGIRKIAVAAFAALTLAAASAPAHAEIGKIDASVAFVSRYVWRGIDSLSNNDPAIQPSITVGLPKNLSLNLWGSMGIGGANDATELDELDITLSTSGSFANQINWTVGSTYYTFHTNGPEESRETYAGLSFPNVPLKPSVTVYGDWGSAISRGYYFNVAGTHDIPLEGNKRVPSIAMTVSAGYCDGQWSMESGLSDVNVTLSAPIDLAGVTVSPFVTYTHVPDKGSAARGDSSPPKINFQDEIYGGLNVALKF